MFLHKPDRSSYLKTTNTFWRLALLPIQVALLIPFLFVGLTKIILSTGHRRLPIQRGSLGSPVEIR